VLVFFLMFVLPQFATVLRDFGVKLDPIVVAFLGLSDFMRAHTVAIPTTACLATSEIVGGDEVTAAESTRVRLRDGSGNASGTRPWLGRRRSAS